MSGDVQPRKRKDKKRKKDELGVEEPRGTAAALGEGDVFMHSYHEHGTGGHWCAKIIFFSLLAVLVTLIGLIILENRGLTDLEANSVESRYSGVLEGWLEDAPDDDHHDEHTLELLKQHDDDEDDHSQEHDVSQEDHDDHDDDDDDHNEDDIDEVDNDEDDSDHDDEDEQEASDENEQVASDEDEEQDQQIDDDQLEDENSEEHNAEADEDDDSGNDESGEDNEDDDDLRKVDENDTAEDDDDDENYESDQADDQSLENDVDENYDHDDDENYDHDKEDEDSQEDEGNDNNDEEHEEHEEEEGDSEIEVEKLEKEVSDEDTLSEEQPTQEAEEEDDKSQEDSTELPLEEDVDASDDVEDEEFLEADDIDEPLPVVERIVAPKGKPLAEVEDEPTTAKPADTLADEEEYEKQQEELRREEAQASHVWLKLAVGGALLVATHAVVSRAVAPRDNTPASDGHASREDTPSMIDRRMTLLPEEIAAAATPKEVVEEIVRPIVEEKVIEKVSPVVQSVQHAPPKVNDSEEEDVEEEEEEEMIIDTKDVASAKPAADLEIENKELYSDEEEAEEVEEEEEIIVEKKEAPKQVAPVPQKVIEPDPEEEAEEDVPDDVEIIEDEHLEEELEEEEDDEEEISDVDDAELLTRLEAKYGRLPEPDRPGQKQKDGGNSIETDWPGEPSDKYWRQQLDEAEQELRQGDWSAASERVAAAQLKDSVRARWILARAIDASAEAKRDNRLLTRAITAYLDVLKLNERLSDARLREIAERTLDRIRFRGNYLSAEPVYRLLIRRFPDVADFRNNLTVSFLMANRADLAEEVIKETLRKWPRDRIALAHLGFILKTQHNRLEEAVEAFQNALEGDIGPATEPRFYYHYGDSLLLLGRFDEAHEVHKRGAKLGHFLSPAQRSLYNVERLKSRPWWDIDQTPYIKLARALEKSWKEILKEGQAAQTLYEKEKEGLKERGEWSQLDLFVRGQEVPSRCKKAPVTCSIVKAEAAAAGCKRGQVKFSAMEAGTHVRPHVGPTNCRLRMHLGLSNTKDTYIRVDQETRQWQVGKVLMFDDSFEHEVWHNGTGTRLVLIVDVWHPALTAAERRSLPPI